MRDSKDSVKFMQVLDRTIFLRLSRMAKTRGVTVQELIRVIVIPYWMNRLQEATPKSTNRNRDSDSRRRRKHRIGMRIAPIRRTS
jgi:hypothetical protein